jgi:hypothetical protein
VPFETNRSRGGFPVICQPEMKGSKMKKIKWKFSSFSIRDQVEVFLGGDPCEDGWRALAEKIGIRKDTDEFDIFSEMMDDISHEISRVVRKKMPTEAWEPERVDIFDRKAGESAFQAILELAEGEVIEWKKTKHIPTLDEVRAKLDEEAAA